MTRSVKKELFEHFARIGKAVANPHRLELLDLLCQGEHTVEQLAKDSSLTIANTSQHLQVLRRARLIDTRREGPYVYYRLADDSVCEFWLQLQALGRKHLAEVDQLVRDFFESRDALEPIEPKALAERIRTGEVTLLDVRPSEEYEAGHIAGARSVPLDELSQRLNELPRDQEIVAYCRGAYCVLAPEALKILQGNGFRARRLQGGFPEWHVGGLPVVGRRV